MRSSAKEHGLGNQIEGEFQEGQRVVVIEDLISTGGSSLKAVQALRDAGLNVLGLSAIFTYGFDKAEQNFNKADCKYITLSDYDNLIEQASKANYIVDKDIDSLKKWKSDPENWSN